MTTIRVVILAWVLALCSAMLFELPKPASADEPPPEPGATATPPAGDELPTGPSGWLRLLPDPKQWATDVFNDVLIQFLQGIAEALHRVINGVLTSSLNFITQTPPSGSYASPTVQGLWTVTRNLANAALALVVLWGGFNLMVREGLAVPYHEAMELFPRIALGTLLVNTSLAWSQLAIDANNSLCSAIGGAGLPAWERADANSQLLADIVAALIYLITSLLLLLQSLARLALIDILLVTSPLALLCWILPQTQGWARLWSSTFFGAVFTQFVQVSALKLGGALLTELTPMAGDSALLALLLGVAVLALTLKVPGLMRHHLGDGMGFVRYIAYRRVARTLEAPQNTVRSPQGGN